MNKDSNLFDKKIRDQLKFENSYVPDNINNIFDESINMAVNKRKLKHKKYSTICAACLAGTIILGLTMPAYADNLSIFRNIFKVFESNISKHYNDYASDLNVTKESKGIKVTINKVVYDGIELVLFYTVESEKPMEEIPYFLDTRIKINGNLTSFSSSRNGKFLNDNKIYVGEIDYSVIPNKETPKEVQENTFFGGYVEIPDEFKLSLEINSIGGIKEKNSINGKWYFDMPISNEKVHGKIKEKALDIDLNSISKETKVNKIISSPINTVLNISSSESSMSFLNFIVYDDKGRYINPKGANGTGVTIENNKHSYFWNYQFKEIYDDTESLTFIPYIEIVHDDKTKTKENGNTTSTFTKSIKEAPPQLNTKLNLKGETQLKTKEGKEYGTITKIDVIDNNTKLHVKSKYFSNAFPIKIVDNTTGEEIQLVDGLESSGLPSSEYNKETNEFIVEYNKALKGNNYSIYYIDHSGDLVTDETSIFTVDISK